MKRFFKTVFIALLLSACSDPVFYMISKEPPPLTPRVPGSASSFAVYERVPGERVLYVASGDTLHWYRNEGWDNSLYNVPKLSGIIRMLAATDNYLYALYVDSNTAKINRIKQGGAWEELNGTDSSMIFQSIYAPIPGGPLFIGEGSSTFNIYYVDDSLPDDAGKTINSLLSGSGELVGVAHNGTNYFICTKNAIYEYDGLTPPSTPVASGKDFYGIISLEDKGGANDTIVAIDRAGNIYTSTDGFSGSIAKLKIIDSNGKSRSDIYSNGALAIWRQNATDVPALLLAGVQNQPGTSVTSGYFFGYLELELDKTQPNGIKVGAAFAEPGQNSNSSVPDNEHYRASIGSLPLPYILQAPNDVDTSMRLFVATQKKGLWSYREGQWNVQD
jgi:hypothetical protein